MKLLNIFDLALDFLFMAVVVIVATVGTVLADMVLNGWR